MDKQQILDLLYAVKDGAASPEDALTQLKLAPFQELGFQSRGSCCQAQGGRVRGWRYSPGTGHMGAAPRPLQLPGPFNHRSDSQHWGLHLSLDCQFM